MDGLEELSDLPLALQKSDVTWPVTVNLIRKPIEVFSALRTTGSEYYAEACSAV